MNLKIQRILAAFDGSSESEEAFAAMMPLVRAAKPEVDVLYVLEPSAVPNFPPPGLGRACVALQADGMDAQMTIREGKPAEEILRYATERQHDLIVMETEGRGGLQRLARRSTAEEVLRHAESPVLLVRPGAARRAWSKLMIALDGSGRAEEILEDILPLAKRLAASVELVRVKPFEIVPTGLGDIPAVVFPEDPLPYLRQVEQRLLDAGIDVRIAAPEGRAASALLDQARKSDASLLCMTTHGRTGLERFLMGSVAEEVVRHASCPVLIRRTVRTVETLPEPAQLEPRRASP